MRKKKINEPITSSPRLRVELPLRSRVAGKPRVDGLEGEGKYGNLAPAFDSRRNRACLTEGLQEGARGK